jgi:hypothetical protein
LTDVISGKPGKNVIPGSEKVLNPNTFLKCYANGNVSVTQGELVTGASSSASGPVLKIIDKNSVEAYSINIWKIFINQRTSIYSSSW